MPTANDPAQTELWLVRHAESTGNKDGVLQGQQDQPLSPLGHLQAKLLARRLQGQRFAALYCSDLQRARGTAQYVAQATSLLPRPDQRLREIDCGAWSGLTNEQIAAAFPEEWAAWHQRDPRMRRGGGESYVDAGIRITEAIESIAVMHPGQRVLVIFHGAVLRIYLATLLQLDLSLTWHLVVSNTGICRVKPFEPAFGGTNPRVGHIVSMNDLAHLDQGAAAAAAAAR